MKLSSLPNTVIRNKDLPSRFEKRLSNEVYDNVLSNSDNRIPDDMRRKTRNAFHDKLDDLYNEVLFDQNDSIQNFRFDALAPIGSSSTSSKEPHSLQSFERCKKFNERCLSGYR